MKKLANIISIFLFTVIMMIVVSFIAVDNTEQNKLNNELLAVNRVTLPLNKLTPPLAFSGDISQIEGTNFVIIFDDSGSMSGSKLREAKNALRFFLQNIKQNDTVSMIALNSGMYKGKNDIFQNFESISADGGTPLGKALKNAKSYIEELIKKNEGYGKYMIVSISDGVATDVDEYELEELLKSIYEIKDADVGLKTIGFYMSGSNMLNSKYAEYIQANSMADLQNAFSQILAEDDTFSNDSNVTFN